MDREEATETLRQVERLEHLTAQRIRSFWQPMFIWAALALITVPLSALNSPACDVQTFRDAGGIVQVGGSCTDRFDTALIWYWAFALPIGLGASILLYRRREIRPPVPRVWIAAVAALLLLSPLGTLPLSLGLGSGDRIVMMLTIVALANLAFGMVTRTAAMAWVSGLLFLLCGLSIFFSSHRGIVLSSAFAGGYLIAGSLAWSRASR